MSKKIGVVLLFITTLLAPAQARDAGDRTQTIDSNRARSETRIERVREDRKLDSRAQAGKAAGSKVKKKNLETQ